MAHDVFISYSTKDQPVADAARALLEARGISCWIASRDIPPGAPWADRIPKAIASARIFLIIFSGNANASEQVQREVDIAASRHLTIIPLRIEDTRPENSLEFFLNSRNWLDAFPPPLERHLDHLAGVMRALLDGVPPPVRAPAAGRRSWTAALGLEFPRWRIGITLSVVSAALVVLAGPALYLTMAQRTATAPVPMAGGGILPQTAPAQPAGGPGQNPDVVDLDFGSIDTMSAPSHILPAGPILHAKPIAIAITERDPPNSIVVFQNNVAEYNGQALAPTVSQNFLTQNDTGNKPASFTLTFAEPVARVTFMLPKVFAATASGVSFPAWRAVAMSADGEELSSVSEKMLRRFADFPAQTYTLNAPGLEGIASVKFYSDPRDKDGVPRAGFSTILIESMTLSRPPRRP